MLVRVPDVSVDLYLTNRDVLAEWFGRIWTADGVVDRRLPLSAGDAAAMEDLLRTYLPYRDTATDLAIAARERGDATFTLEVDLPERAADDVDYVVRLLGRIAELAEQQDLVLPAPPEIQAFRVELFAAIAEQFRASS